MRKKNLKQKYVCIINMKHGVKPMISIANHIKLNEHLPISLFRHTYDLKVNK